MTLLPTRYRRFDWRTRAELAAALAAVEQQRDRAIGKARAQRDALAAYLERKAGAYLEDAAYLDADRPQHLAIAKDRSALNAAQRRAIADELRQAAGEIDAGDTLPPAGRLRPGRTEGVRGE